MEYLPRIDMGTTGVRRMRVLVTDMRHLSIEEEKKVLAPLGVEIVTSFSKSEEELISNGRGAAGFLVSYAMITGRVMESLPELKIVSKYGVGVENIDIETATRLGIYVTNVPDYCIEEVALHTLALILAGLRKVCHFAEEVKTKRWSMSPETENIPRLSGLCLGLLGFGRIAKKLSIFMQNLVESIYFYDPYIEDCESNPVRCSRVETLDELFKRSHIVSVHVPLSSETVGLIDERVLSNARGIMLINTSRAEIVVREAVIKSLNSGRVSFFGSDVFWQEPPDYGSRWQMQFLQRDDVLVTPHVGWYSRESEKVVRRSAAMEIARVIKRQTPKNLINKDVLSRPR